MLYNSVYKRLNARSTTSMQKQNNDLTLKNNVHNNTHTTHNHFTVQGSLIHRESKKGDTILLSISLLNIDRFS